MISEVPRRFVEQLSTIFEAMRRRCLAGYDLAVAFSSTALEYTVLVRKTMGPAVLDAKKFITKSLEENKQLTINDRPLRNRLLEHYLGIAVISLGLISGIFSGGSFLNYLFSFLLPVWAEAVLFVAVPIYWYQKIRKNTGVDDTERRLTLFGIVFLIGAILGHAGGPSLYSTLPSLIFVTPIVTALLVDSEVTIEQIHGLFSDRTKLLQVILAISVVVKFMLVRYVMHGLSVAVISTIGLDALLLYVHFCIAIALMKTSDPNGQITESDLQLGYICVSMLFHCLVGGILGNSHFNGTIGNIVKAEVVAN